MKLPQPPYIRDPKDPKHGEMVKDWNDPTYIKQLKVLWKDKKNRDALVSLPKSVKAQLED